MRSSFVPPVDFSTSILPLFGRALLSIQRVCSPYQGRSYFLFFSLLISVVGFYSVYLASCLWFFFRTPLTVSDVEGCYWSWVFFLLFFSPPLKVNWFPQPG